MAEKTDLQPLRFVTLGMFIIDEFSFADDGGQLTGKTLAPQGRCIVTLTMVTDDPHHHYL